MLIVRFSIGCDEEHENEVLNVLDEWGVQISKRAIYNEKVLSNERERVVYFDCLAPYKRFDSLIEYFDVNDCGNVILTY